MKARTLRGPLSGCSLLLGYIEGQLVTATIWDGLLLTKRHLGPVHGRLLRRWRGRVLAGGLWWREIPHPLGRNPRSSMYYPDTLMNALTWPIRQWLVPGCNPLQRLRYWWREGRYA